MLVTSKEIILKAKEGKYAIGAFNFANLETLKAIIAATTKLKSPLILATSEKAIKYAGLDFLASLAKSAADDAFIPIALHLDHGKSLEMIQKCLEAGYTSLMIDGSALSFEENINLTKQAVDLAHAQSVPIEGELGKLGLSSFTDINQINEFIKKTGVDYLALALGSAHGIQEGEHLNFELLDQITNITDIPLVLHGGSGVPDNDIRQAIQKGICKINIDTDLRIAFTKGIEEGLKDKKDDYREILTVSEEEVEKIVEEKIKLFGSDNV